MTPLFRRSALGVSLAALLALPACGKKDDAPAGPGMNLRSSEALIDQSRSNLKQIARAMHAFHDAKITFRRASGVPTGRRPD